MTTAVLRSAQAGAILTALGLSVGLMTGVADAEPRREHACLSPIFPDSNLNERYDVKERIIGPPASPTTPACREAFLGEKWVRAVPPWITAPDKIDEFIANFEGARYVIDAGTPQEKTVTAGPEILRTTCPDEPCKDPIGRPFAVPVSPVFDHLSVGPHTSNVFVTMNQENGPYCNGLNGTVPGLSTGCLPGGESQYPIIDLGGGTPEVGLIFNVVKMNPKP